MPLAGTQGRGGVNAARPRTIVRNVYRGVSFYSSNGGTLGPQQQQTIVAAAQKIPPKVWDQLARAGAKIFIMRANDPAMAPNFVEYLKTREAPGNPRRLAPPGTPPLTTGQIKQAYGGARDISYIDKDGHPISIIGVGRAPRRSGITEEEGLQAPRGHVLQHETGHAVDEGFGVMMALSRAYHGLNRKTFQSQAAAMKVIGQEKASPFGYSPFNVSKSPAFRSTIPKDYTGGYGDETGTRMYAPGGERPSEVFAESLANYWNGGTVPPKMKTFFDEHFRD